MLEKGEKRLRNNLGYSWFNRIGKFILSDSMKAVAKRVNARRNTPDVTVYPSKEATFRAFRLTGFEDTKVVILGQDPYFEIDVADGLAFSSQDPFSAPPVLMNILAEVRDDWHGGDEDMVMNLSLERWAEQGVLLLNTILSVEQGKGLSHEKLGWQELTSEVIRQLVKDDEPKVFILWGLAASATFYDAIRGAEAEDTGGHLVLTSAHPSVESYREDGDGGFFGNKHFSKANEFLKEHQFTEIKW